MEPEKPVSSRQSLVLDLPPSCLQFSRKHPDYFVVGTYNLQKDTVSTESPPDDTPDVDAPTEKKSQSRNGSLLLFKIGAGVDDELSLVQTVSQPSALLDLRFKNEPFHNQDVLATVSSTGSLAVFKLDPSQNPPAPLQHLATSRCDDMGEDVLFLQCNWHPLLHNVIAVTTSTGNARLLYLDDEWRISQYFDVEIENSLEAWSIAFSPTPSTSGEGKVNFSVYCGGDDSMLRYSTCSWLENGEAEGPEAPYGSMTLKGKHDAGVTAILPLSLKSQQGGRVVVTGSYDDHLRAFVIFDLDVTYGMRRVEQVVEKNLGGGVWRLDLVSLDESGDSARIVILASCMHAGARVVELCLAGDGTWACRTLTKFEEHKSMNYASDYCPIDTGKLRIASSSFYDKLLCLWESDITV